MTDEAPEGVLDPADLGLDDDAVAQIGEGRYLVSTDEGEPAQSREQPVVAEALADVEAAVADADATFAVAAAARAAAGVDATQVRTDDVSDAFEALLRWYLDLVAPGTDPGEALAVLLAATDLDLPE